MNDVDRLANPQVCKLVVGNKADLDDKRQVSREEGRTFADNLGVPFLETSAKTAMNVNQMFTQMCTAIANRQGAGMNQSSHASGTRITPGNRIGGGNNCPC